MNPAALLGGLRPVPFIDPLEIQQQQAQTSIMRDKAKASRQDMADEDAVRGALQASGGKMDDATFAKIAMANPRAAQALAKMAHDSTNSQYQAQESALKAQREQIAIDNAKNEQRALRINAIKNEPQRKLVFDGIKDPEERAAYEAAGEYGTESWKNFQDVLTRSAQDAKTQAELASRQNEDGYKANAEQRAAAAEAYQETLRKYNLIEAENRAKDSTRDPVTGLNAVNRATVATRAPEADPQSVREFKYAQTQGYKGTYQQYQNEDANRRAPRISVSAGGGANAPADNPLVDAIAADPNRYFDLTATDKRKVLPALNARGISVGKPLTEKGIQTFSDMESGINSIGETIRAIRDGQNNVGPFAGWLTQKNPWASEGGKRLESQIALTRQLVGKALEGGVLRKEDESKYQAILGDIRNTPGAAVEKLGNVQRELESKLTTWEKNQRSAGRSVPKRDTATGGGGPKAEGGYIIGRKYGTLTYQGGSPGDRGSWK
jgi:hypothetical protein